MSYDCFNLDELADQLGRDRREIEKLANRGRLPGRKVGGEWQFHQAEITHWLEREMREFTDRELAHVEQRQRSDQVDSEVPVSSLLRVETVQIPLNARTKRSVLESMVEVAGRTWQIWEPATVLAAVQEREELMSTAFDLGVAIPHPRNPLPESIGQPILAFGRTLSGIPFGAPSQGLTDLFFLVLCRDSRTHLHILARLGRLLQLTGFVDSLRKAETAQIAHGIICAADESIGNG
jgi:PTS system nitrogen regulatory IIA component